MTPQRFRPQDRLPAGHRRPLGPAVLAEPSRHRRRQRQKGRPGGKLAQLRDEYGISQTQLGEVDLTSQTINLCTLGMRGIAANILWI